MCDIRGCRSTVTDPDTSRSTLLQFATRVWDTKFLLPRPPPTLTPDGSLGFLSTIRGRDYLWSRSTRPCIAGHDDHELGVGATRASTTPTTAQMSV